MQVNVTPSRAAHFIVGASFLACIAWLWSNPGLWEKLWIIVIHSKTLWVVNGIGFIWALFRKFHKPKEFVWLEFPVLPATTFIATVLYLAVGYYHGADLQDREIWNSHVARAEYWEEWTEEEEYECDCDENNENCRTCTRKVHHPPSWDLITSINEEISISEDQYRNYAVLFQNEKKEELFHMDQISDGDGNMFYTVWKGQPERKIASSTEYQFVNYFRAANTIKKRIGGHTRGFEQFLKPYPRVHGGEFGRIEVDRVIDAGAKLPSNFKKRLDRELDVRMSELGPSKQSNCLVYFVGTSDQYFLHALEEHWINGKKNDTIVIVGVTNFPEIDWVGVISWTKVERFKVDLRNRILEMETLQADDLVKIISSQIALPGSRGGFVRMPMAELEYLVNDVALPWYAQLICFIFVCAAVGLTSWALENNEIRTVRFGRRY